MKLSYVIKFVADMNRAVKFYRDVLGLSLKFESPGWSEFVTGETTLSLHPASEKNPAGAVELGFRVVDIQKFHEAMGAKVSSSVCLRQNKTSAVYSHSSWTRKAGIVALAASSRALRRIVATGKAICRNS